MKMRLSTFFAAWVFCGLLAQASLAASVESRPSLQEIRSLARENKFQESLDLLKVAEEQDPTNQEIKLERARIFSWQGRFGPAQDILSSLDPNNDDVLLVNGYLEYYQSHFEQADTIFHALLKKSPSNKDAQDGLDLIKKAKESSEYLQNQIDIGGEYSGFQDIDQPSWWQEFVQFTHFSRSRETAVSARFADYRQFHDTDKDVSLGLTHRLTPWLSAYGLGGMAPDSDFKPRWHMEAGGEAKCAFIPSFPKLIDVTFDFKHDAYRAARVNTWKPGMRFNLTDTWHLAGRMVRVAQDSVPSVYGWDARLDGEIVHGLKINAGYADAGETVSGSTVKTVSLSTGVSIEFTPAHTLRFGYTHDDREKSYIRHLANASFSYNF